MLQRAASNRGAGHIKTKQSKWLEQNLQDMEEKVQYVLSLIQDDGDSFAKRAEKYYKSRPELISFVEDSYHAFKALAERYDHVSTELQKANNTLATCFPEQFQSLMDEDDEYGTKTPRVPPDISGSNSPIVPKDPKPLAEHLKGFVQKRPEELHGKNTSKDNDTGARAIGKSGLSKTDAIKELDRLHKDILGLQTLKEYIKSSYQIGLEKYGSIIENTIMEKQQKVSNLQDEFDIDKVIEDDQAQRLMAEATLKSCQETLTELQETRQKSVTEAKEEKEKIEDASHRLQHIEHQYLHELTDGEENKLYENNDSIKTREVTLSSGIDLDEVIQGKIKQQFDISSMSLVPELAEKIDTLVSEVVKLQSSVSSQTALIDRLRSESHELQEHIRILENNKATLMEGTHDLRKKVKELQEKLNGVQHLNRNVEILNSKLETRFNEAQSSLDNISDKLSHVKSAEELNAKICTQDETTPGAESNTQEKETSAPSKTDNADCEDNNREEQNDDLNWQLMLLNGVEDKEKLLLKEYTTILKNYKDVRRKLSAMENKERNDRAEQITELRVAIAERDEEIQRLGRKLVALRRKFADTKNSNVDELSASSPLDDQKIDDITLEGDNYFNFILSDHNTTISPVEEKLRMDIDTILEENLDFWLRFSTSFQQIQKFKTSVKDLQREISQIRYKTKQQENKITASVKSEIRQIYKQMKEIETELKAWLKQSVRLKEEVERRFSSLCNVQEKISFALKESVEGEEIRFSSHQAAKFQGEILNMKQENNKVSEELQTGVDHIASVQIEVVRTLRKLDDEFGLISGNQNSGQAPNRAMIQFRKLIFGSKLKKQKSIVS